jgi:hypothetical protein
MTVSTVETFEHDIADEIKHKDASLNDIVTATNEIGNVPEKNNSFLLYIVVSILILCAVAGIGIAGYFYQTKQFDPFAKKPEVVAVSKQQQLEPSSPLRALSLTLSVEIGGNVRSMQKTNDGYILMLESYPPVFSYIVRNESSYIQELADKVYIPNKKPSNQKPENTASSTVITKAVTASTTQGTSTTATTSLVSLEARPFEAYFSDVTINNQNMRIWTHASGTVVYAFVNTRALVISSSTEGILALRNLALQKK